MTKPNSCKPWKSVDIKWFLKGKRGFTSSCLIERRNTKKNLKKRVNTNKKGTPYLTHILEKRKGISRYNIPFSQLKKEFIILYLRQNVCN